MKNIKERIDELVTVSSLMFIAFLSVLSVLVFAGVSLIIEGEYIGALLILIICAPFSLGFLKMWVILDE